MAGPGQSLVHPLGEGGTGLHDWAFATRSFRAVHGMEGGETGRVDDHAAALIANVGATIMGRNMFGPSAARGATIRGGAGGFENLDGGPAGYECIGLASSPVVAHDSFVRKDSA